MSLTATCGVFFTAGSRGASMLAVMWWGAPWTGVVVLGAYRPFDRNTLPKTVPICVGVTTADCCEHEPAPSEVARAHSASDRIRARRGARQPGAPEVLRVPDSATW